MQDNQGENADFKYSPEDNTGETPVVSPVQEAQPTPEPKSDKTLLNWSAPNSLSSSKSALWYLAVAGVTLVVTGLIYLLTKDKITAVVFIVSGLLFSIYGAKKPKVNNYKLSRNGFSINDRDYSFGNFRSFAIVHQGDTLSAIFTPLKRFMPYTYIYFTRDLEKEVTAALTAILPKEISHGDALDRALRRIGF